MTEEQLAPLHCGFTLEHYAEILELMKGKVGTVSQGKQIALAHDIDISPAYALELARLEAEKGIQSTYYILLHSDWYSALSPENMATWEQLANMGHELALHYDGRFDSRLEIVSAFLCAMTGSKSWQVSQHLLGITPTLKVRSPLVERSRLVEKGNYQYIADSGGRWRHGCICQHLEKRLLAVVHPIWWVKGTAPFDAAAVDAKAAVDRAKDHWVSMVNEHRKT